MPTRDQASQFRNLAKDLAGFIREIYLPDVEFVAAQYPEYSAWGRGPANFIAFGGIDLDPAGRRRFFVPGRIRNAGTALLPVDDSAIKEDVASSWYNSRRHRAAARRGRDPTDAPQSPAPTLGSKRLVTKVRHMRPDRSPASGSAGLTGEAFRCMTATARARWRPSNWPKPCPAWLDELQLGATSYADYATPAQAAAAGFTEAPRGALGHWLAIGNRKIERYQVLTPHLLERLARRRCRETGADRGRAGWRSRPGHGATHRGAPGNPLLRPLSGCARFTLRGRANTPVGG